MSSVEFFFFFLVYWTQGLVHAMHTLCHWAMSPTPTNKILYPKEIRTKQISSVFQAESGLGLFLQNRPQPSSGAAALIWRAMNDSASHLHNRGALHAIDFQVKSCSLPLTIILKNETDRTAGNPGAGLHLTFSVPGGAVTWPFQI
jgi:hypothetical protein